MNPADEAAASLDRRTATIDLVAATRTLMHAAATSDLPADDLAEETKAIQDVASRLARRSRPRVLRIPFELPGSIRAQGPDAVWQTYELNPFGIPLQVRFDGDSSHGTFVADGLHEGPPDSLHGGWSAHLMDCMLGGLVQATGAMSVTATLDLRYRHKVPLERRVDLLAEITGRSGRKIRAQGRIEVDGIVCVEARGLFVRVDGGSADQEAAPGAAAPTAAAPTAATTDELSPR
ncbi:PaaI family thioesterase [Nocardioides sp. AE5]|uniref:PaaI family thioesterase n=1 Tax=Nocardioides sp. AE5 TaxID=2962573 RepID=UPI002880D46F|nr:PaaI family thioesterase [Nocardioides sp. AE5]MDT0203213.1 PaaI family thioesterase [Nocardioides sp. AE5]